MYVNKGIKMHTVITIEYTTIQNANLFFLNLEVYLRISFLAIVISASLTIISTIPDLLSLGNELKYSFLSVIILLTFIWIIVEIVKKRKDIN